MSQSPAEQELFDLAILRVLDSNRTRWGLSVEALGHLVGQFGFPTPAKELLLDRLDYLVSRPKTVEEVLKVANRAARSWRITEAGIDYVDNHP